MLGSVRQTIQLVPLLFALALLGACGNKGDLYLPTTPSTEQPEDEDE
ncbi:MAG: lipoprotein [Pseudomonadota bacterium]